MEPKIKFVYSWIYDKEVFKGNLDYKKILKYQEDLEKKWKKHEKEILHHLETTSGLNWQEKEIKCYIIGKGIPFSDPLTIPVYDKINDGIDMLIHELIHQIFIQGDNLEKSEKAWDYIFKKYEDKSHKTKLHIPLHAIHKSIYLKFFGKQRLKRDIDFFKKLKDYKESWEIVEQEGYEKIIKKFKELIK